MAAGYGADAPIPFLLLPANNPWNTPVDTLPLDPNSDHYIAHMAPDTGLHPDFGTVWGGAPIGIPYVVVPGDQPKVPIDFYYADESDPGPYPIPPDAPVEGAGGWLDDGDRHVLVLDPDHQLLYEIYDAHKDDDHWHAGSGAVFDLTSNALRPDGWTSADAAGLPILPGLVRYDETVEEGVIDHALRFTVETTQRAYVYLATHFASDETDPDLPPMGLRVRPRRLRRERVPGRSADHPPRPQEVRDDAHRQRRRLVRRRGAGSALGRRRPAQPRPGERQRLRGRRLTGAAARRLLREPAGDGTLWTATVDYDGAGGGAGPAPLSLASDKSFELACTWPDECRRSVRVAVTNDLADTATTTVAVTVRSVAPKMKAGADARVRVGARLTRACSFADPGADRWSGSVSYGDGSARWALRLHADKTFTLAHRFPRARGRSYTVVVTVRDDDRGRGTARFRVTVR